MFLNDRNVGKVIITLQCYIFIQSGAFLINIYHVTFIKVLIGNNSVVIHPNQARNRELFRLI